MQSIKRLLVLFVVIFGLVSPLLAQKSGRSFYEIRVYHIKDKDQENRMDQYLKSALMPALKRQGIKAVGIFKPVGNDTLADKRIYVLTPFNSATQFASMPDLINKDDQYLKDAAAWRSTPFDSPAYERIESIFLQSFAMMPHLSVPAMKGDRKNRIYELRSYESPTDELFKNKVHMFNEGGEIKIFDRLGFNAVFYGSVIAGGSMPNLMYMTSFEDRADREAHWKAFGSDPEWKKLSSMKFYHPKNVSKIETTFLNATDYSGI